MHWNHRVWKEESVTETIYTVRETYYNDAEDICGCTENPSNAMSCDSVEGLKEYLQMMLKAVDSGKDVLNYDNFEFADWDE